MKHIIAAFALMSTPVAAQEPVCGEARELMTMLQNDFQEEVLFSAIRNDGLLLLIAVSPQGTWSEVIVSPNGNACLAVSGLNFEIHRPSPAGSDM